MQKRLSDFVLSADSFAVDVGGYRGDWAADISMRYGCRVVVFEPVSAHLEHLRQRFQGNGVSVMPFGLMDRDCEMRIGVDGDRSGVFTDSASSVNGVFRDVASVITEPVDVMKMNVEGAEYAILERMIGAGVVGRVRNLLVQFHREVSDYEERYEQIAMQLDRTHRLMWRDPFVWECWAMR